MDIYTNMVLFCMREGAMRCWYWCFVGGENLMRGGESGVGWENLTVWTIGKKRHDNQLTQFLFEY